jgi:Protein of unknown function (DUF3102)
MKQKNVRPLDTIADSIHKLERGNIIDIGDLLLEAKAQCEHGDWLDWLDAEFKWWSEGAAERYMRVAKLSAKFCNLRNLRLGRTTLYKLAEHECEEDLPAIIKELVKHATKTSLKPRDAERVIKIGIARNRFGDHPDATLVQLVELDNDEPWYEKAVAALQQHQPKTDESACSIVDEFMEAEHKAHMAAQKAEDAEREARLAALLDAPPSLPPPTTPPEPQKLHADTAWEGTELFAHAVADLRELRTKPVARFAGRFSPDVLREVADFLMAVAAADKKEAA